jgi:hypothetical protein
MALRRSTTLPPDLKAAIDADLSLDAMRGLLVLIAAVTESLDPRFLPFPAYRVIASLCHDPKRWAVVFNSQSPYAFVRAPVEHVDLSIWTLDLRAVLNESKQRELPPEVWTQVRKAAQRYLDDHPAPVDESLLDFETEGNA